MSFTPPILNKMAIIEAEDNYNMGAISNLLAYLLSTIKNDYHSPQKSNNTVIEENEKEYQYLTNKMQLVV